MLAQVWPLSSAIMFKNQILKLFNRLLFINNIKLQKKTWWDSQCLLCS